MSPADSSSLHPETLAVLAGRGPGAPGDPLAVPVHLTSTYHAGAEVAYARDGNPSWTALEEALGALEGGDALVFASGMGAATAVLSSLPQGSVVVAPFDAYTGTRAWLRDAQDRGQLRVRLVDVTDTAAAAAACQDAALLWVESPTNPLLGVADIAALAAAARDAGATLVVDNTFATPLLQQPLDLGADVVLHSATKLISGHSDVVAGALVTRDAQRYDALLARRTVLGAALGPLEAFLVLRGLRSLPVRLARAQSTALDLAHRLAEHPDVRAVRYPGLRSDPGHARATAQMRGYGAMISFDLADAATADAACAATRVIVHATSLGGIESTMERRRSHPGDEHVPEGLIRLSVGCEHPDDLWADLAQALERATGGAR